MQEQEFRYNTHMWEQIKKMAESQLDLELVNEYEDAKKIEARLKKNKHTEATIKMAGETVSAAKKKLEEHLGIPTKDEDIKKKSTEDWDKIIATIQAERDAIAGIGDMDNFFKETIEGLYKKRAEGMADTTIDEQNNKVAEFNRLENEEKKEQEEKITKEEDPQKKKGAQKKMAQKLSYYEKKVNEVEEKIKPTTLEEFEAKIKRLEERKNAKLKLWGVDDKGNPRADISYYKSAIEKTRREADKLSTSIDERPIQFALEAFMNTLDVERDREIASGAHTTGAHRHDEVLNIARNEIYEWRQLGTKKPNSLPLWEKRLASLEERLIKAKRLKLSEDKIEFINDQITTAKEEIAKKKGNTTPPPTPPTPSNPTNDGGNRVGYL